MDIVDIEYRGGRNCVSVDIAKFLKHGKKKLFKSGIEVRLCASSITPPLSDNKSVIEFFYALYPRMGDALIIETDTRVPWFAIVKLCDDPSFAKYVKKFVDDYGDPNFAFLAFALEKYVASNEWKFELDENGKFVITGAPFVSNSDSARNKLEPFLAMGLWELAEEV